MLMLGLVAMGLIATTVTIHAIGTVCLLSILRPRFLTPEAELSRWTALGLLISTATFLLFLHFLEILLWAIVYLRLPTGKELADLDQAIYFSSITFTTLGYGDLTIRSYWHLLTGIEAMNGILLFGWSTALLFGLSKSSGTERTPQR